MNAKDTAAKAMKWLDGMFSDNGVPSSSRVLTALLIAFVMGMTIAFGCAVVIPKHIISMQDFTGYLEKAGWFLSSNILALYGTNRIGNALDRKFGNNGGANGGDTDQN